MKTTAQQFFDEQLITDANSVIDKTRQKYSRQELIRFAEVYAKDFAAQEVEEATRGAYSEEDMRKSFNEGRNYQRAEAYEDRTGEDHNSPNFDKWILTYCKQPLPTPPKP